MRHAGGRSCSRAAIVGVTTGTRPLLSNGSGTSVACACSDPATVTTRQSAMTNRWSMAAFLETGMARAARLHDTRSDEGGGRREAARCGPGPSPAAPPLGSVAGPASHVEDRAPPALRAEQPLPPPRV